MEKRLKSLYSCCLFILVILCQEVPCQATEYCVKSTAADHENVSYHGQPCHTIDHYADPLREYLKLNNTVFTFLPGEHVMNRPLVFENVENITLQVWSDKTTNLSLVPTFVCDTTQSVMFQDGIHYRLYSFNMGCSILQMTNVTHAIVSGLTIIPTERGVSAIIIQNSTDIHVHRNDVFFDDKSIRLIYSSDEAGIVVLDSQNISIESFQVTNAVTGIAVLRSNNVNIVNAKTMHCYFFGVLVVYTNYTRLINITTNNNTLDGIFLVSVKNASLQQVYSISNTKGLHLAHCTDTFIENTTVQYNNKYGIHLESCVNTVVTNVTVSFNENDGIFVSSCHLTTIRDTLTMNNDIGITIRTSIIPNNQQRVILFNVYAVENNFGIGIHWSSGITEMVNVIAARNTNTGIYVLGSVNTILNGVTVEKNEIRGINVVQSNNTTIRDITATFNGHIGFDVDIVESFNTTLNNAIVINHGNKKHNVNIIQCQNITIMNITIVYSGVFVEHCSDVTLIDMSINDIQQSGLMFLYCKNVVLAESTFRNVHSNSLSSTTDVRALSAIIVTHNTSFVLRNCSFIDSNTSSIMASDSTIQLEGDILFSNISAISGAAFIFSKSSVLILSEHSNVVFQNNHVRYYGAVFYITTEEFTDTSIYISSFFLYHYSYYSDIPPKTIITSVTKCFIQVEGIRSTARLIFINNTAERGGDVVYGGLVALGYDGDWNCLLSFKNISDITRQSSEMPSRRITSAPSRVCICRDDMPDCLIVADTTPHVLYPGQNMTVSAAVVGQDFGTVKGEVIAQFLASYSLSIPTAQTVTQYENGECMDFSYTVYSSCDTCEAELVLTAEDREITKSMSVVDNTRMSNSWSLLLSEPDYKILAIKCLTYFQENNLYHGLYTYYDKPIINDTIESFFTFSDWNPFGIVSDSYKAKLRFPKEMYTYPLYITVTFHPCPLGFIVSHSKCDCIPLLQQMPEVECNIQGPSITRRGSVWIGTYHNDTVAVSKYCPLHYCKTDTIELSLHDQNTTNEDSQCNYNHAGILCGGCQHGHSLALGSEQCLHCSNAYIALILPFALAGIFLVCFIKVLNFTVCQGTINGLIFYANVVNANKHLYYDQTTTNPITLFIAWFNLDLGIKTCFYDGLTPYARTWLQFVFPLYIWSLAGGIIFLANHSRRVAKLSGNNGVPVLATLFLLSYAKLFTTIIKAVSYTTLHTTQGDKLVWSVDGNIDFLGPKHAPLFAAAVAALVFLWLPYTLLLLFGKYLHKINYRLLTRILMKLKPFLDANYAPFNDRHQYWFGGILIVKAVVLLCSAIIPADGGHVVAFSVALSSLLLVIWGPIVFSKRVTALFHSAIFINLAILNMNIAKVGVFDRISDTSTASFILIGLTLVQFLGLILLKVVNYIIIKQRDAIYCCRKRKPAEDDWELFLQASEQRDDVSESDEGNESDLLGSIVSLPTY